jgi:hypothetical protein
VPASEPRQTRTSDSAVAGGGPGECPV